MGSPRRKLELLMRLEAVYDRLEATWNHLTSAEITELWQRAGHIVDQLRSLEDEPPAPPRPDDEAVLAQVEKTKLRVLHKNRILEQELARGLEALEGQIDLAANWEAALHRMSSDKGASGALDFTA